MAGRGSVAGRLPLPILFALALAVCGGLFFSTPSVARSKKPPTPKTQCARASYPGDPVCDVGDEASPALPTPTSRGASGGGSAGYEVQDGVSVRGRSDFNGNRYGGTSLNNPNPNPRSQNVNGGAGVNFGF